MVSDNQKSDRAMRAPQKRTLRTREKLLATSRQMIEAQGYEAVRVDGIVKQAGVAKGTFFSHFKDKEALMDLLLGERIEAFLDEMETQPAPNDLEELIELLLPLYHFMTHERYVFDVILRHSGAAAIEEIGPIAETFGRHNKIVAKWLEAPMYRKDVPAELLAEGVQAFSVQAMALMFCALHNSKSIEEMLRPYLSAWLLPQV